MTADQELSIAHHFADLTDPRDATGVEKTATQH